MTLETMTTLEDVDALANEMLMNAYGPENKNIDPFWRDTEFIILRIVLVPFVEAKDILDSHGLARTPETISTLLEAVFPDTGSEPSQLLEELKEASPVMKQNIDLLRLTSVKTKEILLRNVQSTLAKFFV